jgi:ADP-ribose pyrophosphatase
MHVFLATDLRPDPLEQDEDELLSLEKVPVREALAMAERGEIQDAKTLAALLLARPNFVKNWGISG